MALGLLLLLLKFLLRFVNAIILVGPRARGEPPFPFFLPMNVLSCSGLRWTTKTAAHELLLQGSQTKGCLVNQGEQREASAC